MIASTTRPATFTVPITLGIVAGSWMFAASRMGAMDMGAATRLGSWSAFLVLWIPMMAAMMLPGATPAIGRQARAEGRLRAVALFVASYLAVWTLVGLVVYVAYRPHGPLAAGVTVLAAGLYELTPLKRYFRRQCRDGIHSGFGYGMCCVGSSIGLMLIMVALGIMSPTWMCVIAVLALVQRLLPPRAAIDVPTALAIIGVGAWILLAPLSV